MGLFLSPLTHALSQERSGVRAYSFDDIRNIAGRGRHTGRRAALWALPPSLLVEGDMDSGRACRALRIRDRSHISLPDTTSPNAPGSGSKMKQRNPRFYWQYHQVRARYVSAVSAFTNPAWASRSPRPFWDDELVSWASPTGALCPFILVAAHDVPHPPRPPSYCS